MIFGCDLLTKTSGGICYSSSNWAISDCPIFFLEIILFSFFVVVTLYYSEMPIELRCRLLF